VGTGHLPEGLRLAVHAWSQVPRATYTRALQALQGFDRKAAFAQIACPVLLITGEQDAWATPASTQALAAMMGSGKLSDVVVLKAIAQFANLEAPEAFDGALLNWLAMSQALQNVLH
jgi:3-oxoadipate enol-lactonase